MHAPADDGTSSANAAAMRSALQLAWRFAVAKLAFHLLVTVWVQHIGTLHFRDEFYYVMCGRRLDWGYVDHGPLVAVQARLAELLFGDSIVGLRSLSALGGALRVALTGVLCCLLGGRRPALALAMLCVAVVPIYLGIDSVLSMNSWESAFWMTCVVALIRLVQGGRPALWWTVFGVAAGVGFLNKLSIVFFLAALLLALMARPQRNVRQRPQHVLAVGTARRRGRRVDRGVGRRSRALPVTVSPRRHRRQHGPSVGHAVRA